MGSRIESPAARHFGAGPGQGQRYGPSPAAPKGRRARWRRARQDTRRASPLRAAGHAALGGAPGLRVAAGTGTHHRRSLEIRLTRLGEPASLSAPALSRTRGTRLGRGLGRWAVGPWAGPSGRRPCERGFAGAPQSHAKGAAFVITPRQGSQVRQGGFHTPSLAVLAAQRTRPAKARRSGAGR